MEKKNKYALIISLSRVYFIHQWEKECNTHGNVCNNFRLSCDRICSMVYWTECRVAISSKDYFSIVYIFFRIKLKRRESYLVVGVFFNRKHRCNFHEFSIIKSVELDNSQFQCNKCAMTRFSTTDSCSVPKPKH